jgi:diguanylate cyclase (GGDEF)-like protein
MEQPFVLIVEDERDIAALFRHVMDLAGYRTEVCTNGTAAMLRMETSQPDVVLLDLSLPGISGVNILQRMRVDERLKGIPVVVVTAYAELAESMAVEPDLVMLKPVSSIQLTDLVQRLARTRQRPEAPPTVASPWDETSGLYNRAFFMHRLQSAITSMQHNGQSLFGVLVLSPDQYELITHQYSLRQADEYVRAMTDALRGCLRPTDTLARFEGDRFLILIEQPPGLQIPEMVAGRIQERLKDKTFESTGSRLTPSIGVLLCDKRYRTADEVILDASSAYDAARRAGPGACRTFDHDTIQGKVAPS